MKYIYISASKDRGTVVEERLKRVQEQKLWMTTRSCVLWTLHIGTHSDCAACVRPIPALWQTQILHWEGSWEWQELMNMNPQFWRNKVVVRGGQMGCVLGNLIIGICTAPQAMRGVALIQAAFVESETKKIIFQGLLSSLVRKLLSVYPFFSQEHSTLLF